MIWNAILCSLLLAEFQAANQLYDAGQFADAAAAYERIEPKTAHVYFNLGNALFRQEKFGLAVLNYERARQLAPRDPDILANLKFARDRLGIEESRSFLTAAVESRTIGEWSRYELVAMWLTVLAVAGAIWLRRARSAMILIAVVAGLTTATTAGVLVVRERAAPSAIVVAGKADARFAPAADATVHFSLPEGAKVAVLEDRGGWSFVERADGQQGWVQTGAIQRIGIPTAR
jgi:tetratricopeptide (TPR) repeat protein